MLPLDTTISATGPSLKLAAVNPTPANCPGNRQASAATAEESADIEHVAVLSNN